MGCCLRRWYCWAACLLLLAQFSVLFITALNNVLERQAPLQPAPVEEAAQEVAPSQRGSVPVARLWAWKYGTVPAHSSRSEAWVLCPGKLKRWQLEAFKPKMKGSLVISLNRYFNPPVFEKYGLLPTHHWHYTPENVANGWCMKELKRAQKDLAKRTEQEKKVLRLKFDGGFGECHVAQETALAAAKNRIPFIAKKPVIKLLRALDIPHLHEVLREEEEWLEEHPLPLLLAEDLSLLRGIAVAVSLTPEGSTVKLLGCSGFEGKKSIKPQAKQLRENIRLLHLVGPGWDVVNCDPKSEYVKLGAMQGVSCFDSRNSEYNLESAAR